MSYDGDEISGMELYQMEDMEEEGKFIDIDIYNEDVRKNDIEKARKDGMNAGIALVCGLLVSSFDQLSIARYILNIDCGIRMKQELIDSVVDEHDIEILKEFLE